MESTVAQVAKLAIVAVTGLSKDALHVHFGLIVFFVAAALAKRPLHSLLPWSMVLLVALLGELVDMKDDLQNLGHWSWPASLHDIVNTLIWPTVILVLAKTTALFTSRSGRP